MMDLRSLFAVLAIFFLLWLIRAWVKLDTDSKLPQFSSQQLRNRFRQLPLTYQSVVRKSSVSQALESAAPGGYQASQPHKNKAPADQHFDDKAELKRLHEMLARVEGKAVETAQNDLELRRLRSELLSVLREKKVAVARIVALEKRIIDQDVLVETAKQRDDANHENARLLDKLAKSDEQNSELRADLAAMSTSSDSDNCVNAANSPIKPLFLTPSYRDDLKEIIGIGPAMESSLNQLGITTFDQLARFDQADIDRVSEAIDTFPGCIERERWVGQAKRLADRQSFF